MTTITTASAAVDGVITRLPGLPLQACEPGLTASTFARPHSGWRSSHRITGPMSATAAATRASSQVRREAPCQTSAMK